MSAEPDYLAAEPKGTADRVTDDDLPDRDLFWRWVWKSVRPVLGWVFVGIGLLAILIGWIGISGQAVVAKQLPYLISGGIGGMALVGIGAVFLATEDIRRDSGRLDRLEAMAYELHAVLLARTDAPEISPNGKSGATREEGHVQFMALPQGQTYHRADCAMLQGKEHAEPVTQAVASRRGLKPCRLCEPAMAEA